MSLNLRRTVPQCNVTHRTARARRSGIIVAVGFPGPLKARRVMKGVHDMVLKGFSYAMIGAFLGGLAMTVTGSAGVLMGF